jgi:prenyl protein peptidase
MGWFPIGILETTKSVGLTAVLFLGPLFEAGVVQGGWKDWIRLRGLDMLSGWIGYRNMVAVSLPLVEVQLTLTIITRVQ